MLNAGTPHTLPGGAWRICWVSEIHWAWKLSSRVMLAFFTCWMYWPMEVSVLTSVEVEEEMVGERSKG